MPISRTRWVPLLLAFNEVRGGENLVMYGDCGVEISRKSMVKRNDYVIAITLASAPLTFLEKLPAWSFRIFQSDCHPALQYSFQ
jgi:hypothetical protein